ncbi:MAG: polysaccharide deacetylase family protein [Rhodospirillaceae bacterium]|nr:polysaccharide deacetylase family protein [Rhodospirillaceae bacterium]
MIASASAQPTASPSAVVLMYHRFGEAKYPATNIRLEQLDEHIAYLKTNGFSVLPLGTVVDALKNRTPLPSKAIAITIDDAYKSVVTEAWPRFKQAGFPFTVFVASEAVDKKYSDIMTWDDVRALQADGVTIGAHSHAHPHFPALSADQVRRDLDQMKARFQAELGQVPDHFAYPYGEAGREDIKIVAGAGFAAAFGQNSGPVYPEADMFLLPRFALNETYGAMDRFKLVTATLPIKAVNVQPDDPVLRVNPPKLGFDVLDPPATLKGLSCFGPRGERLDVSVAVARVTITPTQAFPTGRARVNCTLRANNNWHWFGQEFLAGGATEGVPVHTRYRN